MCGRSRDVCVDAFIQLKKEVDRRRRRASRVKVIRVDFELALRKVLNIVFPAAECIRMSDSLYCGYQQKLADQVPEDAKQERG